MLGVLAFLFIFEAVGFDLSSLTLIMGALGVGIGFGLQGIVNNFVSGIIILLERPVKVGDRVDVAGIEGSVTEISLRATTVLTNEGVSVVVPNSQFITQQVVNRSLQDKNTRFRLAVGVAYESDPEHVKDVLLSVADAHPGALKDPKPLVIFEKFGESSLDFFLWVWTRDYYNKPMVFRSEMNFAIHKAFKEAGIVIPFPQRVIRNYIDPRKDD